MDKFMLGMPRKKIMTKNSFSLYDFFLFPLNLVFVYILYIFHVLYHYILKMLGF